MHSLLTRCALLSVLVLVASTDRTWAQSIPSNAENWGQWRGIGNTGASDTAAPPIEWSEDQNVAWKIPIEGHGTSSPIVWEDRLFFLSAIDTGEIDPSLPKPEDQPDRVFGIKYPNTTYQFVVQCLDREDGSELWRRVATEKVPHEGHHRDNDFASASPTTDGERLYCWFGSAGLFCFDLEGNELWSRDLGPAYVGASLGEGCSPVVHKDRLVILRDHSRQSTIEVLNCQTGATVWSRDRDEPNAWATPIVIERDGVTQLITAASNFVRSYDLATGDMIWQCGGLTSNVIPCPIVEGNVVYCMSGYQGYSLLAIETNHTGDISGSDAIRWSKERGTPYIPSPLLYDGYLYYLQSNESILTCVKSDTGEEVIGRTRLPRMGGVYASPVGASGFVFITDREGNTTVLRNGGELDIVAVNRLEDEILSSAALCGKQLFFRGRNFMYCLEQE